MKNLFILPTDKPTGIFQSNSGLQFSIRDKVRVEPLKGFHIYITSDEEIKEGDWCINLNSSYEHKELCRIDNQIELERYAQKIGNDCKKIILTTDQDLITDGVQEIDDTFLEWFVKNPSCESVEVDESKYFDGSHGEYIIIIPQEEPKQECEHIKEYGCIKDICTCNTGPKQETLEEITANLADPNLCKTDNWIACAKWMLEELQDFDTWKEWKDITFKSE
jgi:hypothetical protein